VSTTVVSEKKEPERSGFLLHGVTLEKGTHKRRNREIQQLCTEEAEGDEHIRAEFATIRTDLESVWNIANVQTTDD
jgi:hypothetical protein